MLERNDAWRTTFEVVEGIPYQRVAPHEDLDIPFVDLRHLPAAEREAHAVAIATADARVCSSISSGARCCAAGSSACPRPTTVCTSCCTTSCSTVWRSALLLADFVRAYDDLVDGRTPAVPEPAPPYAHYACWERQTLTSEALAPRIAYWREQLAGIAPVELPADRLAPALRTASGAMERTAIDAETVEAAKQMARALGSTFFQFLLAAYVVLLHRYTGQDDIVIAGLADGRRHRALERIHGFFINPIPVRVDVAGDPTFGDVLGRVRTSLLAGLQHEVPFGLLLAALRPERETTRNPILQVLLSLDPPLPPLGDGWDLRELDVDLVAAKFDLYLLQDERATGSVGRFAYSTDLFDPGTDARPRPALGEPVAQRSWRIPTPGSPSSRSWTKPSARRWSTTGTNPARRSRRTPPSSTSSKPRCARNLVHRR